MTPPDAQAAALRAEIARLEATVATEAQEIEALQRDLAALRADLAAVEGRPGPTSDARGAPPDTGDTDDDLFDDVPV